MTEANQIDGAVRRHLGPLGIWVCMPPGFEGGVPDWHYTMLRGGVSGWVESKLIPSSGRCPSHFTREQLLWGEAEVAAGGRWHLLGLRPERAGPGPQNVWLLYDAPRARAWFDGVENQPIFELPGSFPTREIALALAPRRNV